MIIKKNETIASRIKGKQVIGKVIKAGQIIYENFKNILVSGIPPLILLKSKGKDLVDYKIYGESVQDGTPTPEAPIENESVGEKTINLVNWDLVLESKNISKVDNGYYAESYGTDAEDGIVAQLKKILKPNVTYTLSRIYEGEVNASNGLIVIRTSTGTGINCSPGTGLRTKTFALTQEEIDSITTVYLYFHQNGATISNLMLVEGEYTVETLPEYEPYGYKIPVISRGKNLINIPNLTSATGNGTTIECNLTKPFVVSCQEVPTSIVNSSGAETSIWRLEIRMLDGTVVRLWDQHFRDPAQAHNLKINASEENPVISIIYRGTYIKEGQYRNIQIEYGETPTEYEPYVEPITTNIYLDEPLKENEYISYTENNLPNIPTHKGTTIIEIDTEIQPSNMEVIYKGKPA